MNKNLIIYMKRILRDTRGASAIEYGLIVSLVVIAMIGALKSVANEDTGLWAVVENKVTTNMGN